MAEKVEEKTKRCLFRFRLSSFIYGDKVLWVIIAMLSIISILLVFSSTAKMAYDVSENHSSIRLLATQLGFLALSLGLMTWLHRYGTDFYRKMSWGIWALCFILTGLTYFMGGTTNGAARWLPIVGSLKIQPSEALKVAIVLHLVTMLTKEKIQAQKLVLFPSFKKKEKAKNRKILLEGTLPIVLPIFATMGVIVKAHTSSAILVFIISLLILYLSGVNWKEIAKLVGIVGVIGGLYFVAGMGRSDTAGGRISTWVDTWTKDRKEVRVDYISDTERSMVAIQNGGLFGQGAGQSSMRVEMIHPESDYAYAFFVEEYGLILSMVVLLLYIWIFFRAMWIYERCRDRFKELLVISLATLILIQALLHVMVSVNFLPETGQILPLVSKGGSALFCTYMAFMLMLSISVPREEEGTK